MEKNPILVAFGARVRTCREAGRVSQEELAERTGFHRTYISSLERGLRNPALINILKIADGLSVEACDLVTHLSLPGGER